MITKYITPEIVITEDNSPTLQHPVFGELYHSSRGAIGESQHIFIDEGFNVSVINKGENQKVSDQNIKNIEPIDTPLRILEIGFGSGLNALLTARAAEQQKMIVEYQTIELYPITQEVVMKMSYSDDPIFELLHTTGWGTFETISNYFTIKKIESSLVGYKFNTIFDLIYFDAFAPNTQPEMWSAEIFKNIYDHTSTGGILVTYSAKGIVKENLRAAGFEVKRRPGALGKRHMLQCIK